METAETSSQQQEVLLEAKVNGFKNIDLEGVLMFVLFNWLPNYSNYWKLDECVCVF